MTHSCSLLLLLDLPPSSVFPCPPFSSFARPPPAPRLPPLPSVPFSVAYILFLLSILFALPNIHSLILWKECIYSAIRPLLFFCGRGLGCTDFYLLIKQDYVRRYLLLHAHDDKADKLMLNKWKVCHVHHLSSV